MTHRFHQEKDKCTRERVYVKMVGRTLTSTYERSIDWVLPIEPPGVHVYNRPYEETDWQFSPHSMSLFEAVFMYQTRRAFKVKQLLHKGFRLEKKTMETRDSAWMLRPVVNNHLMERMLTTLICSGFISSRENLWCAFLGQGVYDPRVFLYVADFVYEDESRADANFTWSTTEEAENRSRMIRRHFIYGRALAAYINYAHEDSIDWLLPVWPSGFDFADAHKYVTHVSYYKSPMSVAIERDKPATLQLLLQRGEPIRWHHLEDARKKEHSAVSHILLNAYVDQMLCSILVNVPLPDEVVREVVAFSRFSNDIQSRRKRMRIDKGYF